MFVLLMTAPGNAVVVAAEALDGRLGDAASAEEAVALDGRLDAASAAATAAALDDLEEVGLSPEDRGTALVDDLD